MFPLQALADEINNDPNETTLPAGNIEIDWVEDWLGLTGTRNLIQDKRLAFRLITSTAVLDADSVRIRDAFAGIFAGTTGGTLSRLDALVQKVGTRAEVLWGDGQTISARNVGEAANL